MIAKTVHDQIMLHYNGLVYNYLDLAINLQNDKIDNFVASELKHSGYDKPYSDYLPCIIHYKDKSVLIVTNTSIFYKG